MSNAQANPQTNANAWGFTPDANSYHESRLKSDREIRVRVIGVTCPAGS